MEERKSTRVRVRTLGPAPKRDLQAVTRKRITAMKTGSLRAGVRLERRLIAPDSAKLKTYRRLRAAMERKLAKSLDAEGVEAVFAAGEDLRRSLIAQLQKKATAKTRRERK